MTIACEGQIQSSNRSESIWVHFDPRREHTPSARRLSNFSGRILTQGLKGASCLHVPSALSRSCRHLSAQQWKKKWNAWQETGFSDHNVLKMIRSSLFLINTTLLLFYCFSKHTVNESAVYDGKDSLILGGNGQNVKYHSHWTAHNTEMKPTVNNDKLQAIMFRSSTPERRFKTPWDKPFNRDFMNQCRLNPTHWFHNTGDELVHSTICSLTQGCAHLRETFVDIIYGVSKWSWWQKKNGQPPFQT